MSTHEVKVVKITDIQPHPNADKLEIVKIWGYDCVVKKNQFKIGDLGAFIEPDYKVPLNRPEFSFLSKPDRPRLQQRIAVCRLRGIYSAGLLIPAPEGSKEGENVMELLGVERYEPPEEMLVKGAHSEKGPEIFCPKYDLENVKKYMNLMVPGEQVIVSAKLHGTNARFCWHNNRMYCGSRTQWKTKPGTEMPDGQISPNNAWWSALEQNPWIEEFCKQNPGVVLYGEVVGPGIQKGFHYGHKQDSVGFYVFDILENNNWINNNEFRNEKYSCLKFVPTLYEGPFLFDEIAKLAELTENFNNANHIREGVVIKVHNERYERSVGRVAFKHVSNNYLEKT
jgi:RNA ligase (TIGR02306 family)